MRKFICLFCVSIFLISCSDKNMSNDVSATEETKNSLTFNTNKGHTFSSGTKSGEDYNYQYEIEIVPNIHR